MSIIDRDPVTKERSSLYQFNKFVSDRKPIPLHSTRRRYDPKGFYAPIVSLSDPDYAETWSNIEMGKLLIDPDYIRRLTANPKTKEDLIGLFDPFFPCMANTVLIRYKSDLPQPFINYGVFLVYEERHDVFIKEIFKLEIRRNARLLTNESGVQEARNFTFSKYHFEKSRLNGQLYYGHRLTFSPEKDSHGRSYFFTAILAED